MKATGIIRRIDDLGRVAIPKDIRKMLFGKTDVSGLPIEFFIDKDTIVLKEYKLKESNKLQNAISELENLKKCYNGDEDAEMEDMSFEDYLQNIIDDLKEIKI